MRAWSSPRLPGRRARALLAVVLGLVGLALVWGSLHGPPVPDETPVARPAAQAQTPMHPPTPSTTSPTPAPRRTTTSTDRSDVRDKTTGQVLPESDPVSVAIPTIGVHSRLVELGLDAEGAMEVPKDPSLAGWFTGSAAPGALGPAVIAGHVTWDRVPAVFSRLGKLRSGDEVTVRRKDGRTAVFTVERVARYSKSDFPSHAVYGSIDHAGLRLITCGGTYDTVRHRYLDNVVVFARLTDVRRAH
jgi:LPXTG-site transpeptidase (sortase) family protein